MPAMRIEATYGVVTPLFCAGADSKSARSSPAQLQGCAALLVAGAGVVALWCGTSGGLATAGRQTLRERRRRPVACGHAAGRPSPSRRRSPPVTCLRRVRSRRCGGGCARYLGYGVMEAFGSRKKGTKAGQLTRACLGAPVRFHGPDASAPSRRAGARRPWSMRSSRWESWVAWAPGAARATGLWCLRSLNVNGEARWSTPRSMDELQRAIAALRSEQTDDLVRSLSGVHRAVERSTPRVVVQHP